MNRPAKLPLAVPVIAAAVLLPLGCASPPGLEDAPEANGTSTSGVSTGAGSGAGNTGNGEGEAGTASDASPGARWQSPMLIEPMRQLIAEAIAYRSEGRATPGEVPPQRIDSVLQAILLQHPGLFSVSTEQARRYQRGDFDDEANRRRVRSALQQFQRRELEPHTLSRYLIEQFTSGNLTGVRLELADRLLNAQLRAGPGGGPRPELIF